MVRLDLEFGNLNIIKLPGYIQMGVRVGVRAGGETPGPCCGRAAKGSPRDRAAWLGPFPSLPASVSLVLASKGPGSAQFHHRSGSPWSARNRRESLAGCEFVAMDCQDSTLALHTRLTT
jgi:hypothetical protein